MNDVLKIIPLNSDIANDFNLADYQNVGKIHPNTDYTVLVQLDNNHQFVTISDDVKSQNIRCHYTRTDGGTNYIAAGNYVTGAGSSILEPPGPQHLLSSVRMKLNIRTDEGFEENYYASMSLQVDVKDKESNNVTLETDQIPYSYSDANDGNNTIPVEDGVVSDIQTLSDITRGMQYAVNTTQEVLEHHYQKMLDRYFDASGNPVTTTFNIAQGRVVEAPLITLISPASLALEEMTVEMSIRVNNSSVKEMNKEHVENTHSSSFQTTRSSFQVSLAPPAEQGRSEDVIDIIMKFKKGDTPEGVSRIIDEFTSQILPKSGETT